MNYIAELHFIRYEGNERLSADVFRRQEVFPHACNEQTGTPLAGMVLMHCLTLRQFYSYDYDQTLIPASSGTSGLAASVYSSNMLVALALKVYECIYLFTLDLKSE